VHIRFRRFRFPSDVRDEEDNRERIRADRVFLVLRRIKRDDRGREGTGFLKKEKRRLQGWMQVARSNTRAPTRVR